MRRYFIATILMLWALTMSAHSVFRNDIRSLTVMTNDNWDQIPLLRLGSTDVLNIAFDQMSHDYHRYTYRLQHCDAQWNPSDQLLESDFLVGINGSPIDDYELSINTNHIYTHYTLQLPNDQCSMKMSGNYLLTVYDDDSNSTPLFEVRFFVLENTMQAGLSVSSNTDIDINRSHQQVQASINYGGLRVVSPRDQVHITVMQNGIHGFAVENPAADILRGDGMQWSHVRPLIFDAGNEYNKFEMLSTSHASTNIDHTDWDGRDWFAYVVPDQPRPNYLYDEDADGAFYLRNSDDYESETTSEYVYINYTLQSPYYEGYKVFINGEWTTGDASEYEMKYDAETGMYYASVLQKLGYYNYRYLMVPEEGGTPTLLPSQGSFYETENAYQLLVYYREIGGRSDRLVGFAEVLTK